MRISQFLAGIILFVFILCTFNLFAQPELNSKQTIEGIAIFHDKTDPLLYYYEPGNLVLDQTDNDDPDFRFLDMRYTGSECYNDSGEKSFMSLVQFGVVMQKVSTETLNKIKTLLKKRRAIKLKPLPISHIDTRLILPVESNRDKAYNTIDDVGALEANDKSGYSSSKSFWEKRTYTVKLNKHEAQLLNKQLKDGILGLNLNYAYHSDFWVQEEDMKGSKALVEQFAKDSIVDKENNIKNKIVKNNTLTVSIDVDKYPKAIKQIDLNEEIPPAYAAIEIKCHDFLEDLRPELYMKIVEVEAVSVNNDKVIEIETKFLSKYRDIYTTHINFPYAVQIAAPMRYRVIEVYKTGERKALEWKNKTGCSSIIDVTSTRDQQISANKVVDVEINPELFENSNISKVEFYLFYAFNAEVKTENLVFNPSDELSLQSIQFRYDKNTPTYYLVKKYTQEGEALVGESLVLDDGYVYLTD